MRQAEPAADGLPALDEETTRSIHRAVGGGQPLPGPTRTYFEAWFGRDLSDVRIHRSAGAADAARLLGAQAFTLGSDIAFASGRFEPESSRGRRLLAHELTHVVQQRASRAPIIQRAITEDSIRSEDQTGDFYSTNCGWVDAGHANPGLAEALIDQVREASRRIESREKSHERTLIAERPSLVSESNCDVSYEEGEQEQSQTDAPEKSETTHPSNTVDIILGGFGVNSSAPEKFESAFQNLARKHAVLEANQRRAFQVQVLGFSDCIGSAERNSRLRNERAAAIAFALMRQGIRQVVAEVGHGIDDYLSSNATRGGRKRNRGVLIRFVPQLAPEVFSTETQASHFAGVQVSAVTPLVELTRKLTEEEILSIALSIFSAQNFAFEFLQQWRDVVPLAPPSSEFAEEDLPSSLIAFYRAARQFSWPKVRTICDAWDEERSLAHFRGYTFQRNPSFLPPNLPSGGAWPAEFRTIVAEPFDSEAFQLLNLRLETPLWSIFQMAFNCSVDPDTNALRCQ